MVEPGLPGLPVHPNPGYLAPFLPSAIPQVKFKNYGLSTTTQFHFAVSETYNMVLIKHMQCLSYM